MGNFGQLSLIGEKSEHYSAEEFDSDDLIDDFEGNLIGAKEEQKLEMIVPPSNPKLNVAKPVMAAKKAPVKSKAPPQPAPKSMAVQSKRQSSMKKSV